MDGHIQDVKRSGSLEYVISDEDAPDTTDVGTQTCCDDWTDETVRNSGNTLSTLHKFSQAFDRLTSLYTELSKAHALKTSKEDPRDYDIRRRDRSSYEKYYDYKTRGSWYSRDYSRDRCYPSAPRRQQRQSSERTSDSKYSYISAHSRKYK